MYDYTLTIAEYLISGLVFQLMADGHWSDFTSQQKNLHLRIICLMLSRVMFIEAFVVMIAWAFSPAWAFVMLVTVLTFWFLYDRSL